ncbi:hypothetical protein ES703_84747 [subsurface metagenome]
MKVAIGYAWVFERAVVFGSVSDLLSTYNKRKRKKFGSFVGVVKAVIPVDPFHVLYVYLKHTPEFLQRQKIRVQRRKLHIKKGELKKIAKITPFLVED